MAVDEREAATPLYMHRSCRYRTQQCSGHTANMQRPCRYTCSGHAAIHAASAMPLYMQRARRYTCSGHAAIHKGHINKRVCMDMVGGHGRVGVFLYCRHARMHPKVSCTRPSVSYTQHPSSSSTRSSNFWRKVKPRRRNRRRHMSKVVACAEPMLPYTLPCCRPATLPHPAPRPIRTIVQLQVDSITDATSSSRSKLSRHASAFRACFILPPCESQSE